jgi:hypothetical protein
MVVVLRQAAAQGVSREVLQRTAARLAGLLPAPAAAAGEGGQEPQQGEPAVQV